MKTLANLTLLAAGLLLAGVANAQTNYTQPALTGPASLTIAPVPGPNNVARSYTRPGHANDSYVLQAGLSEYGNVLQTYVSGAGNTADMIQNRAGDPNDDRMDGYQAQVSIAAGGAGKNIANMEQKGDRALAAQFQRGAGNQAKITQEDEDVNTAFQSQNGYSNKAVIQQNSGFNYAQQSQRSSSGTALDGHNNFATTTQSNVSSWSVTDQQGVGHTAVVVQQ